MIHDPKIEERVHWGMTVRLVERAWNPGDLDSDPHDSSVEIQWADENSSGRRISYDTWQFKNLRDAEEFVIMFKLRFGVR